VNQHTQTEPTVAVGSPVERGVRPLGEPLFLLHCGAVFDGEREDWDVEANSGRAVDELADQHPNETLHLYALTGEEVAAVNKLRARKVWQSRQTHLCKCDHNEYCHHCWPESFRPGGMFYGLGA
jgi:hypothetical protein